MRRAPDASVCPRLPQTPVGYEGLTPEEAVRATCLGPSILSTLGPLRCQSLVPASYLLILSPRSLGFNPMWEETLVFTVHMPEIALVRFLVWDHDPIGRDFIGQRTLAFSSMMPGREEAQA